MSRPSRGPQYAKRKRDRTKRLQRARFRLEMLVRCLGAECIVCGETELSILQVDHVRGITWDRYALRYDARVDAYVAEWAEGWAELQVQCMVCHGKQGRSVQLRDSLPWEPGIDDAIDTRRVTEVDPDVPF